MQRWRRRGERGTALVEFAIIAPLFMMLVMGMLDYGLVFRDYLTVANTTRGGARVGVAAGRDVAADYTILQAVKSASGAVPSTTVARVVVFKSDANGTLNATCKTTAVAGVCNVYTPADWALSQAAFLATAKDQYWPPTSREDRQSVGTDYLGVWIQVNHAMVTKLFGSTFTLTDTTVMRVEPHRA